MESRFPPLLVSRPEQKKWQAPKMVAVQVAHRRHPNRARVDALTLETVRSCCATFEEPSTALVFDQNGALRSSGTRKGVPGTEKRYAHVGTPIRSSAVSRLRISSAILCATANSS